MSRNGDVKGAAQVLHKVRTMRRPSFQFYPDIWLGNSKLRRCSHAEKGMWIDIISLLHDGDTYGILRWPLQELARSIAATVDEVSTLIQKGVLKGTDSGSTCDAYIYIPRSGRKNGTPVVVVASQPGPIWYSSRMVVDEYKRIIREQNLAKASPLGRKGVHPSIHLSADADADADADAEEDRTVRKMLPR